MLSNRYIGEQIPAELTDIASGLEIDLIFALANQLTSLTNLNYFDYLSSQNALRLALAGIGATAWINIQRELAKVMLEANLKNLESAERILKAGANAGVFTQAPPIAASPIMNAALEHNYKLTASKLYQIHTHAMNVPIEALGNAYFSVQSGAKSLHEAVKSTVDDLAARGISVARYPGGRQMELAAAVRMITRTSVMQSTNELGFRRMDEYGCDLLVVSSHAGARPLCASYQGRVFSRTGQHEKYPAFSSTSYGEPGGLLGINCRHTWDPFFEGLSREPTEADRDPAKAAGKDNAQIYRQSQEQRYNERKIREWKRRAESMEELGIKNSGARDKVEEWQATQRRLIEETGRTRKYERESISVGSNTSSQGLSGNSGSVIISLEKALGITKGTPISRVKSLKDANPNYSMNAGYQTNCQRCVPAYELRRRGYDVEAMPRPTNSGERLVGYEVFKNVQVHGHRSLGGNGTGFSRVDLLSQLQALPDGARAGIIWVHPSRISGHTIVCEKIKGKLQFIDPQVGKTGTKTLGRASSLYGYTYYRMDNRDLLDFGWQKIVKKSGP